MECKIKTITPVHIGSGEEYNASEYLLSKAKSKGKIINIIKRIDIGKYYSSLTDTRKEEFLVDLTNSRKLGDFDSKISKTYSRYQCLNECKNEPYDTIKECVKSMDKIYIPGSSIKGAIKTALFYNLIEIEDIFNIPSLIQHKNKGKSFINNMEYENLINSYFSSTKYNPAQSSIMKFFQVSDTNTTNLPTVYDTVTIKATTKYGYNYHQRNGNTVKTFIETIGKDRLLKFNITSNVDDRVLNDLDLNNKKDIISLNNIKKSLYAFNKDLIEYELNFAKEYNVSFLEKFYTKLKKENSLSKPLLRIGSGSGFMNTTIGLKIKKEDPLTFDKLSETAPKFYDYEFPKSRKILTNGGIPLGWVKLEF
jgi:CRISPR-associated protein Csm5